MRARDLQDQFIFKCIVRLMFCIFFFSSTLGIIVFGGFTNLTNDVRIEMEQFRSLLNNCVFIGGIFSSFFALKKSPFRASFAILLLVLRAIGTPTWQCQLLLDLVLLTSLSILGTEQQNGKLWLGTHIVYLLFLIFLYSTGKVNEVFTHPSKTFLFFSLGRSFGMGHPNSIALFLATTLLMIWYLFIPKKWWLSLLYFWAGAFLIFGLTLCRTLAILFILFPFVSCLLTVWSHSTHSRSMIVLSVLPVLLFGATVGIGLSSNLLYQYFPDVAFWMRFKDFNILQESGLSLFGSLPVRSGFFDNFYLWMLMYAGLIPSSVIIIVLTYMLYHLTRISNHELLSLALFFVFYGLMENAVAYAFYFFVPLLAFSSKDSISLSHPDAASSVA